MCSVNTKTPHVNHQVCSVTCSVNDWKKLSIEVFGPKSSQLGHGFHEPGIMPNLQSKSLETTVLVLLDLTVHSPSGHAVHPQFSTLRASKTGCLPFPRDHAVVANHRPTPGSQRNRTKHPLAHVLIVGTSIDMIWWVLCSWGNRKSLI